MLSLLPDRGRKAAGWAQVITPRVTLRRATRQSRGIANSMTSIEQHMQLLCIYVVGMRNHKYIIIACACYKPRIYNTLHMSIVRQSESGRNSSSGTSVKRLVSPLIPAADGCAALFCASVAREVGYFDRGLQIRVINYILL